MLLAKILGGVIALLIGSYVGIKAAYWLTVAFAAGFMAISFNRIFYYAVAFRLSLLISREVAPVVTFLVLTLLPLFLVVVMGWKIAAVIKFEDWLTPMSNAILGAGYFLTVYIIILNLI